MYICLFKLLYRAAMLRVRKDSRAFLTYNFTTSAGRCDERTNSLVSSAHSVQGQLKQRGRDKPALVHPTWVHDTGKSCKILPPHLGTAHQLWIIR